MDERVEDVLKQYDMEIQRAYRVRGAYVLESRQGIYLYKGYNGSEIRAGYEAAIQECLIERGFPMVDRYLKTREGDYVTSDAMGEQHVVKRWYLGDECNLRLKENVLEAAKTLANLHLAMKGMQENLPFEAVSRATSMENSVKKRLRELQRVRTYIRNKKEKNLFEVKYLQFADAIYAQGEEASSFICNNHADRWIRKAEEEGDFFHGNYTYHHLILQKGGMAVVQYDKAWVGCQIQDIYYLLRKTLEKNDWNIQLGESILETYQKIKTLNDEERKILYGLLWFPDKFWKIANSYYNSKKSRIPGRNLMKLEEFMRQEEARRAFLQSAGKDLSFFGS